MTNPRQALEEAWNAVHDYQKAPWQPLAVGNGMERFRRFLDAEAWESAAFMLVPERNCLAMVRHLWDGENRAGHAVLNMYVPCGEEADGKMWVADFTAVADNPAIALAQACLKARENSDG